MLDTLCFPPRPVPSPSGGLPPDGQPPPTPPLQRQDDTIPRRRDPFQKESEGDLLILA